MSDDQGRRITVNTARKPGNETATAADWVQARARQMADEEEWRSSAESVVIVDVRLPFGSVVVLAIQIGIIWLGMGAIGAAVLLALGVI